MPMSPLFSRMIWVRLLFFLSTYWFCHFPFCYIFYVVNISFLLCLIVKLCPESNSLIVRTLIRRYEFLPEEGPLLGVLLFSQQYLYWTFCFSVAVQSLSCVWLFWPHKLQQARLPRPSQSPRICSNSWANEFELVMPSNHLLWHAFTVSPFALFLVFSLANPARGACFCQGLSLAPSLMVNFRAILEQVLVQILLSFLWDKAFNLWLK